MKIYTLCLVNFLVILMCTVSGWSQPDNHAGQSAVGSASRLCKPCVRAHMEFLASDALRGRGSGTADELIAATYVASEMEQFGVEPAGTNGTFIQAAPLIRQKVAAPPRLTVKGSGLPGIQWTHGNQILVLDLPGPDISGPLQKIDASSEPLSPVHQGAVIFVTRTGTTDIRQLAYELASGGASAVIIPESPRLRARWKGLASKLTYFPISVKDTPETAMGPRFAFLAVNSEAAVQLTRIRDGASVSLRTPAGPTEETYTWNVVGRISGSDPSQTHSSILLTAHLDHLGIGTPVNDDKIYNGADDDASGTTAVLELARVLAAGPKPRRTIFFALFGSEEKGGLGSNYFRVHPPVALKDIAAYLEFEMIGRPDPTVPRDTLWLTGWTRTNLGPELAAHGAHLVGDPHPAEDFFQRSDNYVFAKQGVIAQTVSSYGLHGDYHRPSDDISHIDFEHMDEAIDSMIGPVLWLANSDFVPQWQEGGRP
jgi:aminopeptidase YwaD